MATINPKPGEIWAINFDPKIGAEQGKKRPGIVINVETAGKLPLRLIVPLTDNQNRSEKHFWFAPVPADRNNGLAQDSEADAFQCKSFSVDRFDFTIGSVTSNQLDEIRKAVALCIGVNPA